MTSEVKPSTPRATGESGGAAPSAAELAGLVGSRICHDFASPLGAIGHGLELMAMTGTRSDDLSLAQSALADALARLHFNRIAFGAGIGDAPLAALEAAQMVDAIYGAGRVRARYVVDRDLPRREVRLAFLGLLCLERAVPWGAEITVERAGDVWRLRAAAQRVRMDPELFGLLDGTGRAPDGNANAAQFLLLAHRAGDAGRRPTVRTEPDGLVLEI